MHKGAPTGVLSRTHEVYTDDFSGARRPLPLCTAAPMWALVDSSLSLSAFYSLITYPRRKSVPKRSSYIVEGLCVCLPPDLQTSAEGADPGGVLYVPRQCQIPLAWEGWVAQPVDRSQDFNERVPTSGHLGGTASLC